MTVLADSAYGTGDFRAELAERGHIDRVKPAPIRAAVPGGFTVDDFTVDHASRHRDLPQRADPTRSAAPGTRPSARPARGCPLRARCTTQPRPGKTLQVAPHDALQRAARHSRPRPRLAGRIPPAPAHGRTHHRLADPRQPQTALPRRRQERSLAASPSRRTQPAPADQPGPRPHRRELGYRLTTPAAELESTTDRLQRLTTAGRPPCRPQGLTSPRANERLEAPRPKAH